MTEYEVKEFYNGHQEWYLNGVINRTDGPEKVTPCDYEMYQVKVYPNGTTSWYQNGKLSREIGPAVTWPIGHEFWYYNGKLHRNDGPAITNYLGEKTWYCHGQLHRLDGPAVEKSESHHYYFRDEHFKYKSDYERKVQEYKDSQSISIGKGVIHTSDPLAGKQVEIDGRKYILKPVSTY